MKDVILNYSHLKRKRNKNQKLRYSKILQKAQFEALSRSRVMEMQYIEPISNPVRKLKITS